MWLTPSPCGVHLSVRCCCPKDLSLSYINFVRTHHVLKRIEHAKLLVSSLILSTFRRTGRNSGFTKKGTILDVGTKRASGPKREKKGPFF